MITAQRILILSAPLLFFACAGTQQPDAALRAVASVTAQTCVELNEARPSIVARAGDRIHKQAVSAAWSPDRERQELLQLQARDRELRAIVSPDWNDEGALQVGRCRVLTDAMWLLFSENADPRNTENLVRSVADMLQSLSAALASLGFTLPDVVADRAPDLAGRLPELLSWAAAQGSHEPDALPHVAP